MKRVKLESLEDVRRELEKEFSAELEEGSVHTRLRILSQLKDVLQQTVLEVEVGELKKAVSDLVARAPHLRRVS